MATHTYMYIKTGGRGKGPDRSPHVLWIDNALQFQVEAVHIDIKTCMKNKGPDGSPHVQNTCKYKIYIYTYRLA